MVPVDSRRIARVLRYSGTCYSLSSFRLPGCHRLWPAIPCRSTIKTHRCRRPYNPLGLASQGLGSSPFARRYLGNRGFFLFLQVLRCFSSLSLPRTAMYSLYAWPLSGRGFPHSEISGLLPVSGSPELIAAVHVLHRF